MFWTIVGAILFVIALPTLLVWGVAILMYTWKLLLWLVGTFIVFLIWPDSYAWLLAAAVLGWWLRPNWFAKKEQEPEQPVQPRLEDSSPNTGDWVDYEPSEIKELGDYSGYLDDGPDEEVRDFMKEHELDEDVATRALEIRDDWGIDDDDIAIELAEDDF